jgi:hypothetical protein
MESIKLYIGTIQSNSGGIVQDTRRPVEFVGEELACRTEYGTGRNGGITDTRGVTETLYKTDDGRLIVHVEAWSHWQGEPTTEQLHEVSEADLQAGGRFEALGFEAGFQDALTLDQALERLHGEPSEEALFGAEASNA